MARPVLVYTLLRVVLFAVAYAVVYALGVRTAPALLVALLVSALGSLFLLKPQRDAIAEVAEQRKVRSAEEKQRLQARLRDEG